MKIHKSCTAGISDEDFKNNHCSGPTTFLSFEAMMDRSIRQCLRPNERIKGMVIDYDGIQLYLETIK